MQTSKSCGSCRHSRRSVEPGSPCRPCFTSPSLPNWEPGVQRGPMQQPQKRHACADCGVEEGAMHAHSCVKAAAPPAPDTNPKTRFGMAKPPIALVPGSALVLMATAFGDGAKKYGPANWRVDPVSTSTYLNAAFRHIVSWQDGEETAEDSGVHHLAHAAACLAILMDAQVAGSLLDDRPKACPTAGLIKGLTKPMT